MRTDWNDLYWQAWEKGHVDYNASKAFEQCPYVKPFREAWERGWAEEAEADARRAMDIPMYDAC